MDALNNFAERVEAPLTALFEKALPQQVLQKIDEVAPLGLTQEATRLLVAAAVFTVLLLISAMTGLLQVGIQVVSLALVARNAIIQVEKPSIQGQNEDAKAILCYLVIYYMADYFERSPLFFLIEAIPFYSLIKGTTLLVISTPTTGVALKIYGALAEPYFGPGGAFSSVPAGVPSATSGYTSPGFVCTVKCASGIALGTPLYCILSLAKEDGTPLNEDRFITSSNDLHSWGADTKTLPFNAEATTLTIAIKQKQQLGSDTTLGLTSVPLSNLTSDPKEMDVPLAKDGEQVGGLSLSMSVRK